jgi:hypothetical protein
MPTPDEFTAYREAFTDFLDEARTSLAQPVVNGLVNWKDPNLTDKGRT